MHVRIKKESTPTLMATSTALPTSPGSDCHVPSPTDGIFAPVFSSKNRGPFAFPSAISEILFPPTLNTKWKYIIRNMET